MFLSVFFFATFPSESELRLMETTPLFNARNQQFPTEPDDHKIFDPVTEYSNTRKIIMILWACMAEFSISLVISGWPAMLPVLVADGVYFEYCSV